MVSKKWFAGKLAKSSDTLASWSKRIDKESEPGTFGATKFSAACVVGACVTAGTMMAVNHFFGPGIDRGAINNAVSTGLCYVELFVFNATLAGLVNPLTSNVISSAVMAVSDAAAGLAGSLKDKDLPVIDFGKIARKSTKMKTLPRSGSQPS